MSPIKTLTSLCHNQCVYGKPFWKEPLRHQLGFLLACPVLLVALYVALGVVLGGETTWEGIRMFALMGSVAGLSPYIFHLIKRPQPLEPPLGYIPSEFRELPADPIPGVDHPHGS